MSGDFLLWLSTPDEDPLPPRRYRTDEAVEPINAAKVVDSVRPKIKGTQPLMMTLVTEPVVAASSSETSDEIHLSDSDGEESDKLFHLKKRAYSNNLYSAEDAGDKPYTSNESMGTLVSAMASDRRRRKKDRAQKSAVSWARKCVSCPEASRIADNDSWSSCSDVSSRTGGRLAQTLNETVLEKYRDDESMRLDTTTLASADVYRFSQDCDNLETFIATTTYDANMARALSPASTTSTVSTSSMDISFDEDFMNYDDECSRTSFVSLYRVSPIECVATEATAASLDVMPGPVNLTYVNYSASPVVTAKPQVHARPQKNSCRMCRLDGLKYHPACPESVPVRRLLNGGTLTQGEGGTITSELFIMKT